MRLGRWARGLSPFLLGVAMAIVALVSAGLLLYGGPGFLPALVVILATQLASVALGLIYGFRAPETDPVESLRRRWLLVLISVTVAAIFSMAWEWFAGFGAPALGQGLGLALLAALPLFGSGAVIGSLSHFPEHSSGVTRAGPAALLGGATGVLLTGLVLFPALGSAAALLLLALVLASTGALVQGRSLDHLVWIRPLPGSSGTGAESHLQAWVGGSPERSRFVLMDQGRVRGAVTPEGGPFLSVDRALVEGVHRWLGSAPKRSLFLGVGRLPLALHLSGIAGDGEGRGPVSEVHLMEGSANLRDAVTELTHRMASLDGREPVPEASSDPAPLGLAIHPVGVEDALEGSRRHLMAASFDLVVLDTLAVVGSPAAFHLSPGGLTRLVATLRPGGVLIMGPLQDGGTTGTFLDRARSMAEHVPRASLYVAGRVGGEEPEELPAQVRSAWWRSQPEPDSRPAFLVLGAEGGTGWPDRIHGYLRVVLDQGGRLHGEDSWGGVAGNQGGADEPKVEVGG